MALINCPECEKQISNQTKSCSKCGYPIKKRIIEWDIITEDAEPKDKVNKTEKAHERIILGGILIVFILAMAVIFNKCQTKTINSNTGIRSHLDYSSDVINIRYAKSPLNIREKPIADSKVLKTLEPNEKIKTKGIEENGFVQILNSESLVYGWCLSKYLQDKPLRKDELERVTSYNLGYSIITKEDDITDNYKGTTFKIRLNVKTIPNDSIIKKICNTLWKNGNIHWEEFYILVYLPDMRIEDPAYCLVQYSNKGFENITYISNRKGGSDGEHTSSKTIKSRNNLSEYPLAYRLAYLDNGGYIEKDNIIVKRFDYLLKQLDNKFTDDQEAIADITVVGLQELGKKGVKMSLISLMEAMNSLYDSNDEDKDYHEYLSIFVVILSDYNNSDKALKAMQQSLDLIGIEGLLKSAGVK